MCPSTGPVPVPGPMLVLRRGEPVAITLVNHLHRSDVDPLARNGTGKRLRRGAWLERLGESSDSDHSSRVNLHGAFTPPRAGTFIYHTHLHDNRQLTSGLYGAMVVLEPRRGFDESVDHVFVLGRGGPALDAPTVINGESSPTEVWKAGMRHRVRLINITPNDILNVSLRHGHGTCSVATSGQGWGSAAG